jgi:hypothetical protein
MRRPLRPLHALTCLCTAAHHVFELAAGTGLVFQPYIGLPRAATMWSVLSEAEGLEPGQLPAYNLVLYAWALSAAAALALETPRRARRWALVGGLAAVPLRWSARHHFIWIKEQARANPAWWNRALAAPSDSG